MKKLIKILITCAVLFATAFTAFAQNSKLKVDSSKIIVVGRVNVVFDEDRDFIFKTRGLDEAQKDKTDGYSVPYIADPSDPLGANWSKYLKENVTDYDIGDFFIVSYRKPKKGENILRFRSAFPMYFFCDARAKIYLPLPSYFDVDIPDGVDALYLGTFNYYVTGDNFTITDFEHIDEYDLAQEELDRALGTHCDMARAILKVVDEDDEVEVEEDAK